MSNAWDQYAFVEKDSEDFVAVRLTDPKFGGLVYKYIAAKFGVIDDNDQCKLEYDYDILDNPGNIGEDVFKSTEFINLLGEILVDILEVSLREAEKNKEPLLRDKNDPVATAVFPDDDKVVVDTETCKVADPLYDTEGE